MQCHNGSRQYYAKKLFVKLLALENFGAVCMVCQSLKFHKIFLTIFCKILHVHY